MYKALSSNDGFRRQAVPSLLYRYLVGMRNMFTEVRSCLKPASPFALVVGHNHTILGGKRFDIDTPDLLRRIAIQCNWKHEESIPLQAYQRYSIHKNNAVAAETLLILRKA
jgi:site-specific DNA-methyltransferase (cytosine-N4-specific)